VTTARIVVVGLALAGLAMLGIAAMLAAQARSFLAASEVGRGEVVALTSGPRHAAVRLTTRDGRTVNYPENAAPGPLAVGQVIPVRYRPDAPAETAVFDGPPYRRAWRFAIAGVVLLIAAAASPWAVARFPGLLTFPKVG